MNLVLWPGLFPRIESRRTFASGLCPLARPLMGDVGQYDDVLRQEIKEGEMPSAEYRFNKSKSISGFLSQNRSSTDALNALQRWSGGEKGRSFKIKTDEVELLIAQLY